MHHNRKDRGSIAYGCTTTSNSSGHMHPHDYPTDHARDIVHHIDSYRHVLYAYVAINYDEYDGIYCYSAVLTVMQPIEFLCLCLLSLSVYI